MPKGNATKYCFPLKLVNGKLDIGNRTLMASGKVMDNVELAVIDLRLGRMVYLEAMGSNLVNVKKVIEGETE